MEINLIVQEKSMQLTNISTKLKKLWDEQQGKDRVHACLFNLIIFTKKGSKDQTYEKLIQSVISKFPCRVIWIKEDSENEVLNIDVQAVALSANIFCEIIQIEAGTTFQDRVPSLVLPHIVPDLPLHLLWTEDPAQNKSLFSHLAPRAKKVILSPKHIDHLGQYCLETLALMEKFPGSVSDLNWSCIKPWRHLFAAIFNTSETLELLIKAKLLKISYNAHVNEDVQHIRAAYFQGWMASCCGWSFQKLEKEGLNFRIHYLYDNQPITVLLVPKSEPDYLSLPSGALLSCEIENGKASYSFKRKADAPQVFWQYSDASRCDLPYCVFLPGITEGQELLEEIFYSSERKHYRNTLEAVSLIPWIR